MDQNLIQKIFLDTSESLKCPVSGTVGGGCCKKDNWSYTIVVQCPIQVYWSEDTDIS